MAETNLDSSGNVTGEWTKTYTDGSGHSVDPVVSGGQVSDSLPARCEPTTTSVFRRACVLATLRVDGDLSGRQVRQVGRDDGGFAGVGQGERICAGGVLSVEQRDAQQ